MWLSRVVNAIIIFFLFMWLMETEIGIKVSNDTACLSVAIIIAVTLAHSDKDRSK